MVKTFHRDNFQFHILVHDYLIAFTTVRTTLAVIVLLTVHL